MGENLKVDLNLRETEATRYAEAYEQPRKNAAAAFGVSLCIQPDSPQYLKGRKHVVLAVPALVKTLNTDDSWQARSAAARALGSLGKAAAQVVPVLEKVVESDVEPAVQKVAAQAVAKITA